MNPLALENGSASGPHARRIALGTLAGVTLVVIGTMLPWGTVLSGLTHNNASL
jgi:hypothetical protein